MSNIANKVVVITGASSGLGEAMALHLASFGANVVLGARRVDRLESLAQRIQALGGKAITLATDVRQRADMQALAQKALAEFGRIDVWINNAGVMSFAPLDSDKVDEWDQMIDVNIKGVLYGISSALPIFRQQDSGHFINISSVAGLRVTPNTAVYSGTKFAVRAISEGLRQEVGANIRTTTILPGAVNSELILGSSDQNELARLSNFYANYAIQPESIAHAVAYAISQPKEVDINEIVVRPTAQEL